MKTNYVLPSEIEKHSFEIIRAELKERVFHLIRIWHQLYAEPSIRQPILIMHIHLYFQNVRLIS